MGIPIFTAWILSIIIYALMLWYFFKPKKKKPEEKECKHKNTEWYENGGDECICHDCGSQWIKSKDGIMIEL